MDRTKDVTIKGQAFQLRRLTPVVGTHIWQLLMRAMVRAQQAVTSSDAPVEEPKEKPSIDQRVRGLCAIAFMFLEFTEHAYVQKEFLLVTSRLEGSLPMPLMTTSGASDPRTEEEVLSNFDTINHIMVENAVFSLASFLE